MMSKTEAPLRAAWVANPAKRMPRQLSRIKPRPSHSPFQDAAHRILMQSELTHCAVPVDLTEERA